MTDDKISWKEGKAWLGLVAVLAILLALLSPALGLAQTGPNTMNFQGRLLDDSGTPLDGVTRCMRFRLCTGSSATCSTQRWPSSGYEYHAVTTGSGTYKAGYFNVTLGDSASYTDYPIPPTLLYDYDALYLQIGVSDDGSSCAGVSYTDMAPLSPLRANAYAQRSRRLRTQEGDDSYLASVENTGQGGGSTPRPTARPTTSQPATSLRQAAAVRPTACTPGTRARPTGPPPATSGPPAPVARPTACRPRTAARPTRPALATSWPPAPAARPTACTL